MNGPLSECVGEETGDGNQQGNREMGPSTWGPIPTQWLSLHHPRPGEDQLAPWLPPPGEQGSGGLSLSLL